MDVDILIKIFSRTIFPEHNDCWEYTGSQTQAGYGMIGYKGKPQYTHRLSAYLFLKFPLDSELQICHRCDNPKCWNPYHLFPGTREDNFNDMKSKNAAKKRAIDRILDEVFNGDYK